jgi:precorrin-6B methylase 2
VDIQAGAPLANARLIMSRARFSQDSVRDGDLLATVGGGLGAVAVFGWCASRLLDGGSLVAAVLLVAPLALRPTSLRRRAACSVS